MRRYVPYIAVLVSMLIWAGSGIAVKEALTVFSPLTLIIFRFTLAVVLMLLVGLMGNATAWSRTLSLQTLRKQDIPLLALGGFFQPFLYFILETYSYRAFASPTLAEAFLSTNPILSPILAYFVLKDKITRNNIIGILISTIGMLVLALVGTDTFELGNPWGIPLALLTVATAVGYTIVLRRIPAYYSSLSIVFYMQLFSLILFYPLWGIVDGQRLLSGSLFLAALSWRPVCGALYLGVLSSVVAFVLFCVSVRKIGVTNANAFNNIRPVFTALIMFVFMNERLPWTKWLGIALIIYGLFISQKMTKK